MSTADPAAPQIWLQSHKVSGPPEVTTSSRGRLHQGFLWEPSAVPTKMALSCEVMVESRAYVEFV